MESMEAVQLEFSRLQNLPDMPMTTLLRTQTSELAHYGNRFVLPLLAISLMLYLALLMAALSFPTFMSRPVVGEINRGLIVVVLQLILAIVTFWGYCRWTVSRFDSQTSGPSLMVSRD